MGILGHSVANRRQIKHAVQFAILTMNSVERNYKVIKKEALAVVFLLKTFCHYLLSEEALTLITDDNALHSVFKKKMHNRLVKWLGLTADYRFKIVYRIGSSNLPANNLSRLLRTSKRESNLIMSSFTPGDDLFGKELSAMFDFLPSVETKEVDQRTLISVK